MIMCARWPRLTGRTPLPETAIKALTRVVLQALQEAVGQV